jgi:hypothetical protein
MDVIERELEDADIRPMFALAHQLRYVTVDRKRAEDLYEVKTKWDKLISALGFTPDWTQAAQISAQTWSDLSTDPSATNRNGVAIDETSWTDYPPRWRLAVTNWFQDRTFQFNTQVVSTAEQNLGRWKVLNRSFWLVLNACIAEENDIEFTSEPDQKPSTTDVNHIIRIVMTESEEDLLQMIRMFCRNADYQREIGERLFPGTSSQRRMDAFLNKMMLIETDSQTN